VEGKKIKLDGREFRGMDHALTAAQDDYLMAHLRLAGAIEVLAEIGSESKRTMQEKSEDLLTRILLSGRTPFILAGALTEIGTKWTREDANKNAAIFAEITDQEEKLLMRSSIIGFVLGFFTSGGPSRTTSPQSSSPNEKDHLTESAELATSATSQ
jgi:hypothetical protein